MCARVCVCTGKLVTYMGFCFDKVLNKGFFLFCFLRGLSVILLVLFYFILSFYIFMV